VGLAAFLDASSLSYLTSARFVSCEKMRKVDLGLNPPPAPRSYSEKLVLGMNLKYNPEWLIRLEALDGRNTRRLLARNRWSGGQDLPLAGTRVCPNLPALLRDSGGHAGFLG
jgi:hypothetical protein